MLTGSTRALSSLLLIVGLAACRPQHRPAEVLERDEYVQAYAKQQVGTSSKKIGAVGYSLMYMPTDYMVLKENRGRDLTAPVLKSLRRDYEDQEYYILEMSIDGFHDELMKYKVQSPEEYAARVDYYAFKFQQDIVMVQGEDSIPCSVYHFERNYGLSPKARFILGFYKPAPAKDRTIVCHERYLGTGPVKFTLAAADMAELPTLKLN